MSLLPFDEVSQRLRAAARSYRGIQQIPVERIIGSVDRSEDFDPAFHPRTARSRHRLDQLRAVAAAGGLPAIVVFEVGGAYFVEDGHHRVALSREQSADFIDAEVTSLITDYLVGPDVDVCQLLHTEQHERLLEETGLASARPEADLRFTLLDGYTQMRDVIDAYGYRLSNQRSVLLPPDEVAATWYDREYLPGLAAIRRADLPRMYASWRSTDGDLFLWVYQLRRDLRAHDPAFDVAAAAQHARTVRLGFARKWHHLHDGGRPLPRRE